MNQIERNFSSLVYVFETIKTQLNEISQKTDSELIGEDNSLLKKKITEAEENNRWFTKAQITFALQYWCNHINLDELRKWIPNLIENNLPKKIGVILAGNIPMVGFHDILSVILSGNIPVIKLSSKDSVLIPYILSEWKELNPELKYEIVERLENYDAVIATGSKNTSKYFEYYFRETPNIIRKNRTSVAVLSENESDENIQLLAKDIFTYFGLGCRNVTKLFLPKGFEIEKLYKNFNDYSSILEHNKYANNYEYHKAIFLLNQDAFYDNGFLLLKESNDLFSPLSVVYISFYENINEVDNYISINSDKIQCVVSVIYKDSIPFGTTQNPSLDTYADGIDTMKFLKDL
ncbi:MAG: acyl-CoA reductase [Flavobacteriales bacterium]|nr:acyl-CoA reductase [Flavobacteriales bacterium]